MAAELQLTKNFRTLLALFLLYLLLVVVGTVVECGMITFIVVLFLDTSPDDVGFFVPLKINEYFHK